MTEVFLDANVLVTCIDTTRRFHAEALALIGGVKRGKLKAFISTQVLGEFYVSITRSVGGLCAPLNPKEAGEEIGSLLGSGLFDVLVVTPGIVKRAVELSTSRGITGIRFWDVVLVATLLENGLGILCTENLKDFRKFRGLVEVAGPESWGKLGSVGSE